MTAQLSLYVTRCPADCGKGTVFDAIDLTADDVQIKSEERLWVISYEKSELRRGTTIDRIHSPKYGFLYSLNIPTEVTVGSLITNSKEAVLLKKVRKSFVIQDAERKELMISDEDMPIVLRGKDFFGVCTSLDKGRCVGDFFVTREPESALNGQVQLDGVEMPGPIYLESF